MTVVHDSKLTVVIEDISAVRKVDNHRDIGIEVTLKNSNVVISYYPFSEIRDNMYNKILSAMISQQERST